MDTEPFLRSIIRPSFQLSHAGIASVLTPHGQPFWEPVSQERWIKALMAYAQRELDFFTEGFQQAKEQEMTQTQIDQMRSQMNRIRANLDEEKIIENFGKMIEQYEAFYEMFKGTEQGEEWKKLLNEAPRMLEEQLSFAESMRQELETMEEELLQALLMQEEYLQEINTLIHQQAWDQLEEWGREQDISQMILLAYSGRALEELEQELSGMSPGERRAAAYGFEMPPTHPVGPIQHLVAMEFVAERPSGLVSPEAEGARAIVSVKPDFFSFEETDNAIELLIIAWWERIDAPHYSPGASHYSEVRVQMKENLWQALDWNALRAILHQ